MTFIEEIRRWLKKESMRMPGEVMEVFEQDGQVIVVFEEEEE